MPKIINEEDRKRLRLAGKKVRRIPVKSDSDIQEPKEKPKPDILQELSGVLKAIASKEMPRPIINVVPAPVNSETPKEWEKIRITPTRHESGEFRGFAKEYIIEKVG